MKYPNNIFSFVHCILPFRFVGIGTFPFVVLIVVNINTSRLNLAKCDDNDYTTWIPTDGVCNYM